MRRKIRDRKISEMGVNAPWIAEHFDPDEISEKTIKRYVYWFLNYVGVDPETLRGTNNQVRFERPLGEFLVELIREDMNSGFLKKVRTDQPFTLEEVNQFQERMIALSHRFPEPWKSQIVETDDDSWLLSEAMDLPARPLLMFFRGGDAEVEDWPGSERAFGEPVRPDCALSRHV